MWHPIKEIWELDIKYTEINEINIKYLQIKVEKMGVERIINVKINS